MPSFTSKQYTVYRIVYFKWSRYQRKWIHKRIIKSWFHSWWWESVVRPKATCLIDSGSWCTYAPRIRAVKCCSTCRNVWETHNCRQSLVRHAKHCNITSLSFRLSKDKWQETVSATRVAQIITTSTSVSSLKFQKGIKPLSDLSWG